MLIQPLWQSFIKATKAQRKSWNQLSLERLEDRLCLSADPIFSAGVLSINGSRDSDTILISDNGQGVVSLRDGDNLSKVTEFRGVERIVVNAGDGDDTIRFTRGGGASSPIPELDIQAGNGHDDVFVGLLLPAVQKVREAAARVHIDLGTGDDRLQVNTTRVDKLDLDVTAGEGDDDVLVGMLLPAVQKVRETAATMHVDLGTGDDRLRVDTAGVDCPDLDVAAGEGNDDVFVGMLLPAVQKVREAAAKVRVDLGAGDDRLQVETFGIDNPDIRLTAGDGDDDVVIGMLLPAVQKVREAAAKLHVDLGAGNDVLKVNTARIDKLDVDLVASNGDDKVSFGLLLPAVQKVREIRANSH